MATKYAQGKSLTDGRRCAFLNAHERLLERLIFGPEAKKCSMIVTCQPGYLYRLHVTRAMA